MIVPPGWEQRIRDAAELVGQPVESWSRRSIAIGCGWHVKRILDTGNDTKDPQVAVRYARMLARRAAARDHRDRLEMDLLGDTVPNAWATKIGWSQGRVRHALSMCDVAMRDVSQADLGPEATRALDALARAREEVDRVMPRVLCPRCRHEGCELCAGRGWLTGWQAGQMGASAWRGRQ